MTAADANTNPEHDLELAKHDMRNCREEIVRLRQKLERVSAALRALTEVIAE